MAQGQSILWGTDILFQATAGHSHPRTTWDHSHCYWSGFVVFLNEQKLPRGQTRNSGKVLSQQQGVSKNKEQIPLLAPQQEASWFLSWVEGRGMSRAWAGGVAYVVCPPCLLGWLQRGINSILLLLLKPWFCSLFCSWLFRGSWVFYLIVSYCP